MESIGTETAPRPTPPREAAPPRPAVQFYPDDAALFDAVSDYLAGGVTAQAALVVIATDDHRRGFCDRLRAKGHDVDGAIAAGQLKLLDARDTLRKFMVDGGPSWELFRRTIEETLPSEQRAVRAYGDMTDLLWHDGQLGAALQLEDMWAQLQCLHAFDLVCAYVTRTAEAEARTAHDRLRAYLDSARTGSRRADTLARITAAIADAVTAEQVYEAVVDQVADAAGASSAGLWILGENAETGAVARLVRSTGYQPEAMAALETLPLDRSGQLPLLDALRSGVPLFISSQAELLRRYPHLDTMISRNREYHIACIPLTVQGRSLGVFAFTFDQVDTAQGERDELITLAGRYCAQALERLRLLDAERKSRSDAEALAHRMGVLSAASRTFAEVGPEPQALLQSVAELVCSTYADACQVHLLEPPLSAAHHRRPEAREAFRQLAAARGLALGEVTSGRLVVVPLRSRGKVIGALAAHRDQQPRDFGEADVQLLQELAERAALAIENGRLYQDNERGRARAEILAGLAGAVNQAKTLEEVLEAAQLALGIATNAPRSAILLFDAEGVMRFRAWRGLSDEYRRAVDGHSPWSRDVTSPAPILVPDVRQDAEMAPFLSVFEKEGIGSVGFIPLVAGRQLVGKFMVYFDGPHTYSAEEREMTAAIANHVAAGAARFASVAELQRSVHFNEMFTAMLGHDLRNPLAAMMMAAQVMLKREDTKALAKPLGRIVSSGARMTRMIDQLLDFTRVRIGSGIPVRAKPTDVRVLVKQVLGELEDGQAPRAVHVESRGDSRGAWDADRLAQVFSNLAANALHHGDPEQPVEVVIDGSAPEQIVVSIHNGGAMEPALATQLFEPMAGRDRRSGKSRGLGLGMFISRQMVLAHGGEIVVDSHPERGTTLTVTLPRPAESAP